LYDDHNKAVLEEEEGSRVKALFYWMQNLYLSEFICFLNLETSKMFLWVFYQASVVV